MIARALVLLQIALRNIVSSWVNVIIGLVMLVGTMLVVVGGALLDSLDDAMSRSVIGSVAGHLQIYSKESKDDLAIYGQMGGEPDLRPMENYAKVARALEKVDNVKTVVPMGINGALVTSGNLVDLTLAKLRELVKKQQAGDTGLGEQIEAQKQHLRQMVRVLQADVEKTKAIVDEKAIDPENVAALERVSQDVFWRDFDRDPYAGLEFLENRIAPQVTDSELLFIRYVGTDLDQFQKSFDRMQIVDGTAVPAGHRGFLFSKFFYEEGLKLKTARRLDRIKEALAEGGKSIAADPVLQRFVKENQSQTREIVLQLDALETQRAVERLQVRLGKKDQDVNALLTELVTTDDSNFQERYRIFYEEIAPLVDLYRVRVGDILTIKAFTRSGYVQSVNVKVYGTFNFTGLEKSPLAGGVNLMDLMSFRDLYGYLTADQRDEIRAMQQSSGAKAVDRQQAEAELFGEGATQVVAEATPGLIDDRQMLTGNARSLRTEDLVRRVYSKDDLENGVVLNAAVLLKDPRRLRQTLAEIRAVSDREQLGLKVVSWQEASGMLGQFVLAAKAALYFAVAIIFVVAIVIINNAMMMATLQRTQTIGTMRAIGAQRSLILGMVLVETLVLGLLFGSVGAGLGTLIMSVLQSKGIAATTDVMYFFFSGPRLHPSVGAGNLIAAFTIILVVSVISTFYPALLATRVSPLRAMQTED